MSDSSASPSSKDAAFDSLRKESRSKLWRSRIQSIALVVSLAVNVFLGLSVTQDSHSAATDTAQTRTIVISVVCGMTPTPAGCPKGSHPTASAQSQQAIIDQIVNGPKQVAKEECTASAQQLSLTTGLPAALLDDPCDAIK